MGFWDEVKEIVMGQRKCLDCESWYNPRDGVTKWDTWYSGHMVCPKCKPAAEARNRVIAAQPPPPVYMPTMAANREEAVGSAALIPGATITSWTNATATPGYSNTPRVYLRKDAWRPDA